MGKLFIRDVAVTVDTLRITGLRLSFRIVKSLRPDPNTCELQIYNLSADSRKTLERRSVPVTIEAGYKGAREVIFKGDLRDGFSSRSGSDWITTLKAGDGETAYRTSRVNESLKPGAAIKDAVKKAVSSLKGLSVADALKRIDELTHRTGQTEHTNGTVLFGQSKDVLDEYMRAHGAEWSIQDGVLQILPNGSPSEEDAIVLNPASGLIGSPSTGDKGFIKCVSLLQPGLRPGRKFKLEADSLPGFYRVESVSHTGDTHGQPWYSELQGRPL